MSRTSWKVLIGITFLSFVLLSGASLQAQNVGEEIPDPPAGGEVPGDIPEPPDPATTALDAEGNPYPPGGPPGLYNAITDKQVKTMDGGGSPGNANALSRLRRNLSRWLQKKGVGDGVPDDPGAPDPTETASIPDIPDTSPAKFKPEKPAKPVKLHKPVKIDKPLKPAKIDKPAKPVKLDKPHKVAKPAKPQKPDKPGRNK